MTSDFFVEWFKTQLLPALKTPHVIVMGNASFHTKNILDELCIQDKHFFLPLPPYSPDLNPIEQAWAILKKKVTDLLREVPTIFECLECFLKLNDYKTFFPDFCLLLKFTMGLIFKILLFNFCKQIVSKRE
ncbi:transposase [Streptococcus pseudopneumoniae]|nr:transposase [Streptococcus pseudopneumoniae]